MVGALRASRHELDDETRREQPARTVVVTTTPGFASLWLIRRLAGFTATRPDVDVRISAACARANLNRDGFDDGKRRLVLKDESVAPLGEQGQPGPHVQPVARQPAVGAELRGLEDVAVEGLEIGRAHV